MFRFDDKKKCNFSKFFGKLFFNLLAAGVVDISTTQEAQNIQCF